MTKQTMATKSNAKKMYTSRRAARSACGVLVGGVACLALGQHAAAAPIFEAPLRAPILSQSLVGLRQGSSGADVKTVQMALIGAGVSVRGGADGQFGPATRSALIDFQGRKGLAQSGEADSATIAALGLSSTSAPSVAAGAVDGLQFGAHSAAVKELQQKLMSTGLVLNGGADGHYGTATAAALSHYQRWNGLTVSGRVDPATASSLGLTATSGESAAPAPNVTAPAPAAPSAYIGLTVGARGDAVVTLQQRLIASGIEVRGGADGAFGPATRSALNAFQSANGLPSTGSVSAADATALGLDGAAPSPAVATPAATSGNAYVGLAVGSNGQLVRDLQSALIAAGITVRGGADGVFGNATKTAVSAYQQANGLGVSGTVSTDTAIKLGLGVAAPTSTPAASASVSFVGLATGARGDKVTQLQQALMATGLVVRGGADGVFGSATKSALIAFQSVNGIPQTGVVTARGAALMHLGGPATPPAGAATTPQASGFASVPSGYAIRGESSERVRVLQQLLIDWKIPVTGGADGSFGNATAAAITKFQQIHGLTVSGTMTQQTADKIGLAPTGVTPPPAAANIKMARFPVQGQCYYGDTWHAARGNGRRHEGTDLIAAEGNLLYAVVDGTITKQYWDQPGKLSGNGLRVAQDDGTYFTYLHMLGFAPGLGVGTKVKAGDAIGHVGNTGSSATAHLHFEIHPGGGGAINPYPYLKAIDDCSNTTRQYQGSFTSGS